jgi:hypothetical protein
MSPHSSAYSLVRREAGYQAQEVGVSVRITQAKTAASVLVLVVLASARAVSLRLWSGATLDTEVMRDAKRTNLLICSLFPFSTVAVLLGLLVVRLKPYQYHYLKGVQERGLTSFSESSISFHFAPRSLPTSPAAHDQPRIHARSRTERDAPNPASGLSILMRSRQSRLKNMYALSGRFGAFLSLGARLPRLFASLFSAALRCACVDAKAMQVETQREEEEDDALVRMYAQRAGCRPPWA